MEAFFTYPTLRYKEIRFPPEVKVLFSETLSQTSGQHNLK